MNKIVLNLTDINFKDQILESVNNKLFLIDFWAEWCTPCRVMSSILEEIAIELHDQLTVAKLNIDDNPMITKDYGVRSIPTFLLIRNGAVLSTKVGLLSKQQLQEFVRAYFIN